MIEFIQEHAFILAVASTILFASGVMSISVLFNRQSIDKSMLELDESRREMINLSKINNASVKLKNLCRDNIIPLLTQQDLINEFDKLANKVLNNDRIDISNYDIFFKKLNSSYDLHLDLMYRT